MSDQPIYRIQFINHGQVYEIYAQEVHQSHLYAFIEVEQLLFGEKNQIVVDPAEEKLKNEFEGVTSTLIPMQSVIRIDQVEKQGIAKISDAQGAGTVTQFPNNFMSPQKPHV
jgi:hypothetical protein